MEEKTPSTRILMLAGVFWFILSTVAALIWSYSASEWWSVAFLFLAMDFLVTSMSHSPPIGSVVTRWYYLKPSIYTKEPTEEPKQIQLTENS